MQIRVAMPRFFFDVSDRGDVYHDARGMILSSYTAARERAFDIVRKLGPRDDKDVVCTVRDVGGRALMEVRIEAGMPMASETKKRQR